MFAFHAAARRAAWVRAVRQLVVTAAVTVFALVGQPVMASAQPPYGGRPSTAASPRPATTARAESKAFVARSRLTTAELIRAANHARSRLPVHVTPPAPEGIPVHPPIIRHALAAPGSGPRPDRHGALAIAATLLPDGPALPDTVSPLTGQVTSPQNEGQTSTIFSLQAQLAGGCGTPCSATTYSGVTFQYRVGTTGSFADIPVSAVSNGGAAVTWPVATSQLSNGQGVQSPGLAWLAKQTITSSGLLQIQAVFTDGLGDSYTTSPVTLTLDKSGTGTDFAVAPVGPVTVGLQSGNLSLTASDVSIASYGAHLSVSRTFNTLAPGTSSAFGPGWTSSLPVVGTTMMWSSVTDASSYAVLTGADGSVLTFATGSTTSGVTSYTAQGPAAAGGLTLTKSSSGFTLTDPSGSQVRFTAANSSTPSYYTASQVTQPGSSRSAGYIYDAATTDASYGQPLLMVAPNPNLAAGTSSTTACPYPASASTWAADCRGLQFSYNSSGKLTQVSFVSYDGSTLTNTPVAAYSHDSTGRLTGEWDPRISPNLVTTYTYDENSSDATYGWLTSVSPAQSAGGGLKPATFTFNTTVGSADYGKLISVTRTHGNGTIATQTMAYEVPLTTAAGGPVNMDAATVGTWNQTDAPASAVAIFPATHVPASPPSASDWQYAQITYYDADGRQVNSADYGSGAWNITTTQYDGYGDQISQLSAADRAEALAAGSSSASVAAELETVSVYTTAADGSQQLSDTYGPLHNASVPGQGVQEVRDHVHFVYDQGAPPTGGPYDLVTTRTETASLGAGIPGTSDPDPRTTQYVYSSGADNTGWTLRSRLQTITNPGGLAITSTTVYNENSSLYGGEPLVVKDCMPSDTSCSGAGTEQTIYYTAGTNPVDTACGNQPAWADLVCKTEPAAQPGTSGQPNLPVTTHTYNAYLEPLSKTENFGSSTRTTTYTYDAAGRQTRMSITTSGSGMGAAVQDRVTVYSPGTGLVTDVESVNSSGTVTADIKTGYDDFGQLTSYTDASGNATTYTYDSAGRVTSRNDGKGTVTIGYNAAGLPTSETDSQAGTFTAAYNPDANVASETYPGGLTASYGYDETGTATSLSYAGQSWTSPLTDSITPNAHGDWAGQNIADTSNSLSASQLYAYDAANRLTSAQDTTNGQCATRAYTYDSDSNRTKLTSYAPASNGACQNTTGSAETYTYDSADRLLSTVSGGTTITHSYDAQGDYQNGQYYANDMVSCKGFYSWQLDPTETRSASINWAFGCGNSGTTYTYHYGDGGNNPIWISGSDGGWTRNVTGIDGMLVAIVSTPPPGSVAGSVPSGVILQLVNLHGDIMATASTSSSSTGPTATFTYSEFGGLDSGTLPDYVSGAYGWLGGDQIWSDPSGVSGVNYMGVRAYDPSAGRFDQVDPVSGGSANAYDYTSQNPVTNTDLTGTVNQQGWGCTYNWYGNWAGGTEFQTCTVWLNQYWTTQMVDALNWGAAAGATCAAVTWWIPGVDAVVTAICALFSGLAWLASATIGWIDHAGNNVGVYFRIWNERIWWWWWGRRYSSWWFDGGYVWHQ